MKTYYEYLDDVHYTNWYQDFCLWSQDCVSVTGSNLRSIYLIWTIRLDLTTIVSSMEFFEFRGTLPLSLSHAMNFYQIKCYYFLFCANILYFCFSRNLTNSIWRPFFAFMQTLSLCQFVIQCYVRGVIIHNSRNTRRWYLMIEY